MVTSPDGLAHSEEHGANNWPAIFKNVTFVKVKERLRIRYMLKGTREINTGIQYVILCVLLYAYFFKK